MSNLKCPICGEKIEHIEDGWCNCKNRCIGSGSISLWQELIRTRRALDVAVKRLGYIKNNYKSWTPDRDAQMIAQAANGLDEIKTALEQKE